MILRKQERNAATVVECAVVFPLFFLLLIGLIVAALGIFRYQEIAALSREAARFASVRGARYEQATGNKATTEKEIFDTIVKPKAYALDQNHLKCTVTWSPDNSQGSQVTVQLSYNWIPEAFLGGITLSAKSTVTISY